MKKCKRLLALLLVAVMLVGMMPQTAFAGTEEPTEQTEQEVNSVSEGDAEITQYELYSEKEVYYAGCSFEYEYGGVNPMQSGEYIDSDDFGVICHFSDGTEVKYSYWEFPYGDIEIYGIPLTNDEGTTHYFSIDAYIEAGGKTGDVKVEANVAGVETSTTIQIAPNPYTHIEVMEAPEKTKYLYNSYESLHKEGLVLRAYKNQEETEFDDYSISLSDMNEYVYSEGAVANWNQYFSATIGNNQSIYELDINSYDVMVHFMGMSTTFSIDVLSKLVDSIEVTKAPDKKSYYPGFSYPDLNGLELKITDLVGDFKLYRYDYAGDEEYSDWSEISNDVEICTNDVQGSTPGKYPVSVQYQGASATFDITIMAAPIASFKVLEAPERTTYYQYNADSINLKGLKYLVEFTDGTKYENEIFNYGNYIEVNYQDEWFNFWMSWADYDSDSNVLIGDNRLIGSDYGTTIEIKGLQVLENPIESIEITKAPDRTEYFSFGSADLYGMELEISYTNGSTKKVTVDEHTDQYRVDDAYGEILSGSINGLWEESITLAVTYMNVTELIEWEMDIAAADAEELELEHQFELDFKEANGCAIYSFTPETTGTYYFFGSADTSLGLRLYEGNSFREEVEVDGTSAYGRIAYELEAGTEYRYVVYSYGNYMDCDETVRLVLSSEVENLTDLQVEDIQILTLKTKWYDFECESIWSNIYFEGDSQTDVQITYKNGWYVKHKIGFTSDSESVYGLNLSVTWKYVDEYGYVEICDDNAWICSYGGKEVEIPVTFNIPSPVESIEITKNPFIENPLYVYEANKGMYSMEGLEITVHYNDGREDAVITFSDVSSMTSFDGYECYASLNMNSYGEEESAMLSVSYMNKVDSEDIPLKPNPVPTLEIVQNPELMKYNPLEEYISVDLYGAKIRITFEDGMTQEIEITSHDNYTWIDNKYGYSLQGEVRAETDTTTGNVSQILYVTYMDAECRVGELLPYSLDSLEAEDITLDEEKVVSDTSDFYQLFRFTPSETGTYLFTIGSEWYINPRVRVYDVSGSLLYSKGDGSAEQLAVYCKLNEGATYYISVEDYAGMGAVYTCMLTFKGNQTLEIINSPTELSYYPGESLSYYGLEFKITDFDGLEKKYKYNVNDEDGYVDWAEIESEIIVDTSKVQMNHVGTYYVEIQYQGEKVTYPITVIDTPIASFEVVKMPNTLNYFQLDAENITLEGLKYRITYKDGSFVDGEVSYGTNTIDIEYQGKNAVFYMNWLRYGEDGYAKTGANSLVASCWGKDIQIDGFQVLENPVESIKIKENPDRTLYFESYANPDLYGMVLEISYANGETKTVKVTEHGNQFNVDDGYGRPITSSLYNSNGEIYLAIYYFNVSDSVTWLMNIDTADAEELVLENQYEVTLNKSTKGYVVYSFVPERSGTYYFFGTTDTDVGMSLYEGNLLISETGTDGTYAYGRIEEELEAGKEYRYVVYSYGDYLDRDETVRLVLSAEVAHLTDLEVKDIQISGLKTKWYDFESEFIWSDIYFEDDSNVDVVITYKNDWYVKHRVNLGSSNEYIYGMLLDVSWKYAQDFSGVEIRDDNAWVCNYNGKEVEIPVVFNLPSPVESIEITKNPFIQESLYVYEIDRYLYSVEGLEVTIHYNDGREDAIVTFADGQTDVKLDQYSCEVSLNGNYVGNEISYYVAVTYMNKSDREDFSVKPNPVPTLTVLQNPENMRYNPMEDSISVDLYGMRVNIAFEDGMSQDITITEPSSSTYIDNKYGYYLSSEVRSESDEVTGKTKKVLYITYMNAEYRVGEMLPYSLSSLEAEDIVVDEEKTVSTDYGNYKLFKFTPSVTGTYAFTSYSESWLNPYAEIYDANGEKLYSENDEYGSDFEIYCKLIANETYYLKVKNCNPSEGTYTCTITFKGNQTLEILNPPTITSYYPEENNISYYGLELRFTDFNGITKNYKYEVNDDEEYANWSEIQEYIYLDSSNIQWNRPGNYNVKVQYQGETVTYPVTIMPSPIVSVEILEKPDTLTYFQGEAGGINLSGLKYRIQYVDGSSIEDVIGYNTSGIDFVYQGKNASCYFNWLNRDIEGEAQIGENSLVASIWGKDIQIDGLQVLENPISSITITRNPNKTFYFETHALADLYGMVLEISYTNGTTKTIEVKNHVSEFIVDDAYGRRLTSSLYNSDNVVNLSVNYINTSAFTSWEIDINSLDAKPLVLEEQFEVTFNGENPYEVYTFVPETPGTYYFFGTTDTDVGMNLYEGDVLIQNTGTDGTNMYGRISYELEAGKEYRYIVYSYGHNPNKDEVVRFALSGEVSSLRNLAIEDIDVSALKTTWYAHESERIHSNSFKFDNFNSDIKITFENGWYIEHSVDFSNGCAEIYFSDLTVHWKYVEDDGYVTICDDNAWVCTYWDQETEIPVQFNVASPVASLEVIKLPEKMGWYPFEGYGTVDLYGAKVRIIYKDGTSEDVTITSHTSSVLVDNEYESRISGKISDMWDEATDSYRMMFNIDYIDATCCIGEYEQYDMKDYPAKNIVMNKDETVAASTKEYTVFAFTPEVTGQYVFASKGYEDVDPFVTIYDDKGERIEENDDSNGLHFQIRRTLYADETYYFVLRCHSASGDSYTCSLVYAEEGNSDFVIADGVLLYYKGTDTEITVPEGVTRIGNNAFIDNTTLASVTIPAGVESIGEDAFAGCTNLTIYCKYNSCAIDYANGNNIPCIVSYEGMPYYIVYNGNGSTEGGMKEVCVTYDQKITLSQSTYKKKGYTFTGWNTKADGSGKAYKPGTVLSNLTTTANKKITFYAQWKKDNYTITYKLNGGTNNSSNPKSYNVTTATITLKNPTKKGYTFGGWYSDSKFKTKVTQITKGSAGNKTLYAKWTATKYSITYKLNGGKNNSSNPANYSIETATITLKNPTRKGYAFGGWFSDSQFKTKVTQITKGSTGNKTLYAKWTKEKYTITYKLNGGTNSSSNPKSYNVESDTIKLKNPTRKGYTFGGWFSDSKFKTKVTKITKGSTGSKTLYAKWTANKYTIKFEGNGSTSGKMSALKVTYDKKVTLTKNAFKKKGYTFVGWNTKADGSGKSYDNNEKIKNLTSTDGKTIKLFAQWKKVNYTITYVLNDGKNNKDNPSAYTVTSSTIKLKEPTRKGYIFQGWYTDKKFKNKITKIAKGSTGDIKLYAKWKKKK